MNADTMKLERDGQLSYGKPDRFAQIVKDCIAAGHVGAHVEYADGGVRCLRCLSVWHPTPSLLPHDSNH